MAVRRNMTMRGANTFWFLVLLLLVPFVAFAESNTCPADDKSCKENEKSQKDFYLPDCRDEDPQCEEWAKAGYCETKPEKTKITCRKSCPNVCDDGTIDWGVPQEASNDETKYGIAQALEYLHTVVHFDPEYENVRAKCKNQNESCASWATSGECDKNPRYMHTSCAVSCQTCLNLDVAKRCPWDPTKPRAIQPGDLNKMFERITTDPVWAKYKPFILSQPSSKNDEEKNKDGPWVVILDDFVSAEECDTLIEAGRERGYERSKGGAGLSEEGEYRSSVSNHRTSYQAWCLDECYRNPIVQCVSERIANLTGVPEQHSEYLQLLKYEEGQYYKVHHDFIDVHVHRPMGPRILTVFLYLNEPEEGGGTNFPKLGDLTVMPKRGRAVIWPSVLDEDPMKKDKRTLHEALPVIKGQKYGANAWLHLADFKIAFEKDCSAR